MANLIKNTEFSCLIYLSFLVIFLPISGYGADQVELLREEIGLLEARIQTTEAGKRDALQQLRDIDRKIELRRRLIRELQSKASISARRVDQLRQTVQQFETQIEDLSVTLSIEEANLHRLQIEVGKRLTQLYKRMSGEEIVLVITANNLNDLAQRKKYIRAIERHDKTRLDLLREKRSLVIKDRTDKENLRRDMTIEQVKRLSELDMVRKLIGEKRLEERSLFDERAAKEVLRQRISADADLLGALLEERRSALEDIENEIKRLETRSSPSPVDWQANIPFKKLAGKLPWPLERRKIVLPFGRITHKTLGTTTDNPGIDLEASAGDLVFSVAKGEVTRVAWLRGFGNTVILSHGSGYYTVYARLGRIMTAEGDVVEPGQTIAEVGESGTDESFHFEIWSKREKQNPKKWLIK